MTQHILFSLVGIAYKKDSSYRETTYGFDENSKVTTSFFGFAALDRLSPDVMVLLGTSGSSWHYLLEIIFQFEKHNALLEKLEQASKDNSVDQHHLNELSVVLSEKKGCTIQAILIPYGRTQDEQVEILSSISNWVKKGDKVSIDITHGLRHLPMLVLLSAQYLQRVKKALVSDIYYGAWDLREKNTEVSPVLKLDGLLRISRWLEALSVFDSTGYYKDIIPLLSQDGISDDALELLKDAAHCESVFLAGEARGKLKSFKNEAENHFSGISSLFEKTLFERIDWIFEEKYYLRQQALAQQALDYEDYVRASIFAYEAVLTKCCFESQPRIDMEDFDARQSVEKEYLFKSKSRQTAYDKAYRELRHIRNQLAHGTRPTKGTDNSLYKESGNMHAALSELFDVLFNPDN